MILFMSFLSRLKITLPVRRDNNYHEGERGVEFGRGSKDLLFLDLGGNHVGDVDWTVSSKRFVHPEPKKVTLSGIRVYADVIKVKILR